MTGSWPADSEHTHETAGDQPRDQHGANDHAPAGGAGGPTDEPGTHGRTASTDDDPAAEGTAHEILPPLPAPWLARLTRMASDGAQRAGRSSRLRRVLGFVVPVALLAAAFVALGSQDDLNLRELVNKARTAPLPVVLTLLLSSVGTIVLTAWVHHLLILRHGRVGFWEMTGVTLSSMLLNYLPMRPGMIGRVGYHRLVNGISLKDNIKVLLWSNLLVMLASGGLLALCVGAALGLRICSNSVWFALLALAPMAGFALLGWHAHRVRPAADPQVYRPILGMAIRWAELHLWAARFWAAFQIVGVELGWGGALALAAAHTIALMIPISGNGLGLSEWFLGYGMVAMPTALSVAAVSNMEVGLAAGVIARGFEVIPIVPLGLLSGVYVRSRLMDAQRQPRPDAEQPAPATPHAAHQPSHAATGADPAAVTQRTA
jgi:hypothetical protein